MVFKCQEDSFLKEFTSNVVACNKSEFESIVEGKKTKLSGYEVVLEDTILFPEGGGQPYDLGYLNEKRVHQVIRRGALAVHYLTEPLKIGETVKQVVDWPRRVDHMQQHSGQHLITAIIEQQFNFPTVAWWLGEEISHIELDTPNITGGQIKKAEIICNELIAASTKVTVTILDSDASQEEINKIRARGLPDDHVGDIRVVNIDGVDINMCCGTHVTNLSQLQSIKLLHTEKSKRKNKTLLYFLVGNRVLNRLQATIEREQKITAIINNGPQQHVEVIAKLMKSAKLSNKNLQVVLKELAVNEAQKLKAQNPPPKYFVYHKKEGDSDFVNAFIREIGGTEIFLFLATGEEKTGGNIVLYGKEKIISDLGNNISDLLEGKGSGKGNRFQAKVSKLANIPKVVELIKLYFQ